MKANLNSALIVVWLALNAATAGAAPVSVAVIPFSAPLKDGALQTAAEQLPDLLTVALSGQNRFEVVERTKVNAIWSELHLAEDGYVSSATAERLGHILSCNWLIGGSFVQIGTNTEVWIKVIDVQSGVVLDLQTFPYDAKNVSATVSAIPQFLAGIDPYSQPRQFIALGRFADQSLSASRADWSQRLPALIEKHFMAVGYGVVDREAIAPIFSESQFESSRMTGDDTNRVVLKPAFWIVDGGYKWIYDTQEKLSVALRVQKAGGAAQIFRFDKPAADVEQAVIECIQSALTNAPQTTPEQGRADEAATDMNTAISYVTGHNEFAHGDSATMRRDAINKLKQVLLLDPQDMQAKFLLGKGLFITMDPEESRQGKELLAEVAASSDPKFATMANNWLDDFATGRLTLNTNMFRGMIVIVPHGQPLSWPKSSVSRIPNPAFRAMDEYTNIVPRSKSIVQVHSPVMIGFFRDITAVKFDHGHLFFACQAPVTNRRREQLFRFDWPAQSTVEINLPNTLDHPIDAIETDENSLWLGTDGNGLIHISKTGELERIFSEPDGFPTPSVASLQWDNGRLLVGFNQWHRNDGYVHPAGDLHDFGYIDPDTGKFTGAMSDVSTFKPPSHYPGPLDPLSPPPGTNANFIATLVQLRCIAFCPPHGTEWTCINLCSNFDLNLAYSCAVDQTQPNIVWIGNNHGLVTVFDMQTQQVIAECHLATLAEIPWIFDAGDEMIFLTMGDISETYDLFCLNKSAITGKPVNETWDAGPIDFLRSDFSKFVPVQFKKGPDGNAELQRLPVQENMFFSSDQSIYFGIKFTLPQWCDGDFQWMYALAKTRQNAPFSSRDPEGFIAEDGGDNISFDPMLVDDVNNYPHLHEIMPYSHSLQIQTIGRESLEPGKSYAIWFNTRRGDYPDILFAMTINSKRGLNDYGTLPLAERQAPPEPITTDNPPLSPEQLRSELETALRARDTAKALSLVYWRGSTRGDVDVHYSTFVYSQEDVRNIMDEAVVQNIAKVTPVNDLFKFLRTTNNFGAFRYRPNIQPVGILQIMSPGRHWVKNLVYGKYGNGYYIPVGVKEPLPN